MKSVIYGFTLLHRSVPCVALCAISSFLHMYVYTFNVLDFKLNFFVIIISWSFHFDANTVKK